MRLHAKNRKRELQAALTKTAIFSYNGCAWSGQITAIDTQRQFVLIENPQLWSGVRVIPFNDVHEVYKAK